MTYSVFEYQYRDAGNFKSFGEIWLSGELNEQAQAELADCLESGEFFVAEQVGIPALYERLFHFSGGRTEEDHAWHTFLGVRCEHQLPNDITLWGAAKCFLQVFVAERRNWKAEMSPNFVC